VQCGAVLSSAMGVIPTHPPCSCLLFGLALPAVLYCTCPQQPDLLSPHVLGLALHSLDLLLLPLPAPPCRRSSPALASRARPPLCATCCCPPPTPPASLVKVSVHSMGWMLLLCWWAARTGVGVAGVETIQQGAD